MSEYSCTVTEECPADWDQSVLDFDAPVSQSAWWGEFQRRVPSRGRVLYATVTHCGRVVFRSLCVRHMLPAGYCYLYAHRGPFGTVSSLPVWQSFFAAIQSRASQDKILFVRFDSLEFQYSTAQEYRDWSQFLSRLWVRTAHAQYQPLTSRLTDLSQGFDAVWKEMSQTARRYVRRGRDAGVQVSWTDTPSWADMESFYRLMQVTTDRDGFVGHQKSYYDTLLQTLCEHKRARLYFARYQDHVLAAAIVTYCGDTAVYYYGGSDHLHPECHAPYVLHAQILEDAAAAGYTWYDWLGVAPLPYSDETGSWIVQTEKGALTFSTEQAAQQWRASQHNFSKITHFKERFPGKNVQYLGAFEYIVSPVRFQILLLVKKVAKIRRLFRRFSF